MLSALFGHQRETTQPPEARSMDKPWLAHYDRAVPPVLAYPAVPVTTVLARATDRYPHHIATRFVLRYLKGKVALGGTLTYQQVHALSLRLAAALQHLGVQHGDRVALVLPNSPQFVVSFFATLQIGGIVVSLNPTYTAHELHYHFSDSAARVVITLDRFVPQVTAAAYGTAVEHVLTTGIGDLLAPPARALVAYSERAHRLPRNSPVRYWRDLLRRAPPRPAPVTVGANDAAVLQYTSGTTARPRAATLTHQNVMANVTQNHAWLWDGRPGNEQVLAAIPFFHVYGLSVCMLYTLNIGGELVIVPNPRQIEHVVRTLAYERCTLFPGVPALYRAIADHPLLPTLPPHALRACISGAAPLTTAVQSRFEQRTGARLVEGYGLSETAPVTHCNPVYGTHRPGSIGVPYPDVEVRLIDLTTGEDLPFDGEQSGELLIRGPQVMRGYWQSPDETATTLDSEGWLRTGDICRADPDGYFYLLDRRKDVMNVGGFMVLPREVEEVILRYPGVQDVAVAGVPHPERGDDTVKAYIVPAAGQHLESKAIRAFCRGYLAPYKLPRQIVFRESLPRNLVGKVLRRYLIESERERKRAAVASVPAAPAVPAAPDSPPAT